MEKLKGSEKMYLKGLIHSIRPIVFIGQNGLSPTVKKSLEESLDKHELIKIKFVDVKGKAEKMALIEQIETDINVAFIGMVGHVATLYRESKIPENRKIKIPK